MQPSQSLTKDMLAMLAEDSADDALIAEELGHHAVTRSQSQAMERAVHTPFIAPPIDSTPPTQATVLVHEIVSQPGSVVTPTHTKRRDPTLRETPELELAREFVRLSYPVTLPVSYSPPDLPTPKGKIRAQKRTLSSQVLAKSPSLFPHSAGQNFLHEVSLQDQAQRQTVRLMQSPFGHSGTAHAQKG
jgi:hypothetical protein